MDKYEFGEELGCGGFGKVYKAKRNGEEFAIKVMSNKSISRTQLKFEVGILERIEKWRKKPKFTNGSVYVSKYVESFETDRESMMVFPLYGENYLFEIEKRAVNNIVKLRKIAQQIAKGLMFLHNIRIIHTDIKPENIVDFDKPTSDLIIVDFGGSRITPRKPVKYYTDISTAYYRAPEVTLAGGWSYGVDIWSFAMTLLHMYMGDPLIKINKTCDDLCVLSQMQSLLGKMSLSSLQISPDPKNKALAINFAITHFFDGNDLKEVDLEYRPKPLKDIISDKNLLDLLSKMLKYNPKERITISEILDHPFLK